MKQRSIIRQLICYAVVILLLVLAVSAITTKGTTAKKATYADVIEAIDNAGKDDATDAEKIVSITLSAKNQLVIVFQDSHQLTYKFDDKTLNFFYKGLSAEVDELVRQGKIESYDLTPATETPAWLSFLPMILIVVFMIVLWIISANQLSGKGGGKFNSFGRAKVKTPARDGERVLFRDVAGADEEKEELVEVVEFLKDPQKYTKLGAKIPHGVLLVGPPGTGKTLLAKAVAGEAGVPFYSISGSDFVEMYVGVGASRVRDLFDTARKSPAAIIFIDEIDAVGRHRGAGLGGGHDEREQTLNQLLVEMDGFGSHDGIIVMAATNRPDILDPALLRPGRFDRQVTVNYPDIKGREAILKVHARNKPLEAGVDFHKIAQSTVGFTGADLANLLNEAALHAAKRGKSLIGMDDLEESYMKVLLGPQKKSHVRNEKDNKMVAYHEAGHAVVTYYCKHSDPVKHITIVPAGRAAGVTIRVPLEDQTVSSRGEMLDDIKISLGGRIAEELIMDDITTGASNDIQKATQTARNMVTRYGMSGRLGPILYGSEHSSDEVFLGRDFSTGKDYSEETAAAIDEEIHAIVDGAYQEAKKILEDHIDRLHFVAQYLLKHESMDGDQFAVAMQDGASEEAVDAVLAKKAEDSRIDNEKAKENARKAEEARQAETAENIKFVDDPFAYHPDENNSGDNSNGDNSGDNNSNDSNSDNT